MAVQTQRTRVNIQLYKRDQVPRPRGSSAQAGAISSCKAVELRVVGGRESVRIGWQRKQKVANADKTIILAHRTLILDYCDLTYMSHIL